MSITDELREIAAKTECANGRCEKLYRGDLEHIADRIDAALAERYVGLPLDADGVPIHVGDVMRNGTVTCIRDAGKGWEIVLDYWGSHQPRVLTHHHEPTVEDVLREMCLEIDRRCERGSIDYDELFAEYAAKLRLAKEGE